MAQVRVLYRFADGDEIEADVYVEENYPDAVAEARTNAVRAVREAMRDALGVLRDE